MKRFILFVAAVQCLLCSCSDSGIPYEPQQLGNIYGVVTVKSTAEPMKATGVELYDTDRRGNKNTLLLKTVTFDDGHFELDNLTPAVYYLCVEASGYQSVSYKVTVEAGRTARVDMQLEIIVVNLYMTVMTDEISDISYNSATFNGKYRYDNDYYKPTEVGFIYSTSMDDIKKGTKVKAEFSGNNVNTNYPFSAACSDLSAGVWYVCAYAINHNGTAYGETRSFYVDGTPVVETTGVNYIEGTKAATLTGAIVYEGTPAYTERGFVYSSSFVNPTVDDPESATVKVVVSGRSKEYSANIAGLVEGVTYYVRAYVKNNNVTVYGKSIGFPDYDSVITIPSEGLMLQKSDISVSATWQEAMDLCNSSYVGGYDDWHLISVGECAVVDKYRTTMTLNISEDSYWTSTYSGVSYGDYYYYYYTFSTSKYYSSIASATYRARCVRSM